MKKESSFNPWMKIWFSPGETIRHVANTTTIWHFLLLSLIAGLPIYTANMGEGGSIFSPGTIILSLATGALGITFYSLIMFWLGKLIDGKASYPEMRSTFAWSTVPSLVPSLFKIFVLLYYGTAFFNAQLIPVNVDSSSTASITVFYFFLSIIFSIWSCIVLLQGVKEVQKFSIKKSFVNIFILPAALFIVPAIVISLIYWIFLLITSSINL